MGQLARIVRHPIKSIGREVLDEVALSPGTCLPGDRGWAVPHAAAKFGTDPGGWAHKMNFLRGVSGPALMAVEARLEDTTGLISLSHPERTGLTIDPEEPEDVAQFLDWIAPLWPKDKPAATGLVQAPGLAMTDVPEQWVSINSLTSLAALGQKLGQTLSPHRFRGNLWVDDLGPWEEFEWIGKEITIGPARLVVRQRITRCKATMANPDTGRRDADTLGALDEGWGHADFGVYAEVRVGGQVRTGDKVALA